MIRSRKKNGELSKRFKWRKSRSGNIYTLGLRRAIVKLEKSTVVRLETAVKGYLDVVTEIRDNSVHYIDAGPELAKHVLETWTACVSNFVKLAQRWFNQDLSKYNLYLMPIGFVPVKGVVAGIALAHEERNLIRYITELARSAEADSGEMHISLEIEVSLKRAGSGSEGTFALTNDPTDPLATKVYLSYDEMLKDYPRDCDDLREHLKK